MSRKELLEEIAAYALFIVILYMFYRSWWALPAIIPAAFFYHKYNKKNIIRKRRDVLGNQFKDALISISAALRAGYSMENAIGESRKEMMTVYGEASPICRELAKILNEIHLGRSTEEALSAFAERSKVPDIDTFSSVFRIAKRGGGNLVEIIRKTADDIAAKIDTQNEISVMISSKKFEQNIMSFMPMGIILYISVSSPTLLEPLYGNITGVLIMTVCLGIYAAAFFLSQKIMSIEV